MGAVHSVVFRRDRADKLQPLECAIDNIIKKSLPPYFINNPVITDNDMKLIRSSWKIITTGDTVIFTSYVLAGSACLSPQNIFCKSFYERLFQVSPMSKMLFRGKTVKALESVLFAVVTTALRQDMDTISFTKLLHSIVHIHNAMGVKAILYGQFFGALFWTISKFLGSLLNRETSLAWIKIYSKMLQIILPIAAEGELRKSKISNPSEWLKLKTKTCPYSTTLCPKVL